MHAIFKTGGKQYRVKAGDEFNVEKLDDAQAGSVITFDNVLAIGDGDDLAVGQPFVEGATVKATVVDNHRGPKIIIFKKRRRKTYRKKQGHRQSYTRIRITDVVAG